ncbi:ATP-binding cassette domain-containing protein [Planomonospora parontospora]|uniref:ATP-binding cassette domain-containing protein n=1 Tax=Planomonospora parontospora TaxID=58119 RepID=UPI00167107C4|nr:ATP-binding cassette domain-containing protein [Planomonospora parontospora]GGL54614.1 daunorubicin resistance protein DrrA family ABC transporter ATP-binding protein [Planomonospora parontospora subsp. antibiotica]GII19768.1 daunorubicin resistance protein DrrA family ABC transporter ATP-binding protein [Planomonospora parontospora subsp. antibiotica]
MYEIHSTTHTEETPPDGPAVHARGLRKSFGPADVLRGVDLTVPAGSLLALLGPNGSGKTTTVRILTTLLAPDGGAATVGGHDVVRDGAAVRRAIGLTAQHATVDDLLTGKENLEMFAGLYHLGRREARRRAAGLLDRFDLAAAADRLVGTYSGGMRRRLDLAASMIATPRILFLDEPTTGLDPRSRAELWAVIRELLASGTTILLTTQYLEEADRLADRIAVIHGGRIVADDTPAALKRQVGAERLELRLTRREDVPRAGAALSAGAEGGTGIRLDAAAREVALASHGPDHLRRTLDLLHRADIAVERVGLRTPTLDDVFFELTEAAA